MKNSLSLFTLASAASLLAALSLGGQAYGYDNSTSSSPPPAVSGQSDTAVEESTPPSFPPAKHPPTHDSPVVTAPSTGASAATTPAPEHQQQMLLSSTTVVGAPVKNAQGETVGEIQEIMIDPESGTVTYAMVTHNGQWGMGKQKSFAVPWSALKVAFDQTDVVVELEQDKVFLPNHVELSQR